MTAPAQGTLDMQLPGVDGVRRGAVLSDDGLYRYLLVRSWEVGQGVTWVLLNPSTADAHQDDATIRKLIGFSRRWGYAHLVVVNLFAWRATDPHDLAVAADPFGPENYNTVESRIRSADLVVVGWGANADWTKRSHGTTPVAEIACEAGVDLWCLGRTASGEPRHPGRLGYDTPLELWRPTR